MLSFHSTGTSIHKISARVRPTMRIHYEIRQALVLGRINGITDHAEDVEAREDGLGELDVPSKRDGAVVAAAEGVGGCDNRAAGLQRCDDAGFGDGNSLLFHGFVDGGAVLVVHLVEFVDQACALISKHERATLECPLSCHGISANAGC